MAVSPIILALNQFIPTNYLNPLKPSSIPSLTTITLALDSQTINLTTCSASSSVTSMQSPPAMAGTLKNTWKKSNNSLPMICLAEINLDTQNHTVKRYLLNTIHNIFTHSRRVVLLRSSRTNPINLVEPFFSLLTILLGESPTPLDDGAIKY